ncbi:MULTISPECIES: lipopolysaccharide biosynthesis protein [Butyricimonas]|uniref:lipopolysaccharide biosynthesis protein n=1 Tax=Butyricimonas TaxID=574697 RepID=UPI001D07A9B1|nr:MULTISPECIES: lipopolysaccharide biosynthesis protein [Butyricimonas]MCB6972385.1 lipopolysaccharide biosynthesis protein [Butyricimonas synergistica]MCG4519393.1 lipopolysaccharide biosynthesis protein [Butyricimonas sp. DFI.6.44]
MSSIKKDLVSGVFYTAIAKYSGIFISLAIAGILARLIAPEEFGIVAVVTVIISFFGIFSDLGIAPAIIQHKELQQEDLTHIFSFTIWSGTILTVLFFFCSWPIAFFYKQSSMIVITQLLSINLFFASANIVPNALLYKTKSFRFIAWRSLSVQVIGGTIAITAALCGAGLYALIINPIFSSILLFIISYRKYPQHLKMTWGIISMKKIFKFSAYQFMFNIINYFSRNLDKILIGKYMDMSTLGYYEKSYRLMMLPLQNITHVITPVMHPIFSNYQHDLNRLATSYEKIIRLLAFIGLPLSAFLWFSAKEVTLIVFGHQWLPSVSVFQILSISVGIQIIMSTSGSIFQASNDTRSLFFCGLFSSIINVTGIFIGLFLFKTLTAIAWGITITFSISFLQCYYQMYHFTLQRHMIHFWKQLGSPALLGSIVFLSLYLITPVLNSSPLLISLIIKGITFAGISIVYIFATKEYNLMKLLKSK